MSLTYDELNEALTDACADRDAIAADLRAAREEVERLRAELAEALATLANERGEGEPPEEGWIRNDYDKDVIAWTRYVTADGIPTEPGTNEAHVLWAYLSPRDIKQGWSWDVDDAEEGNTVCFGHAPTARAAMRAASEAVRCG